jgi:hypothetical protein
MTFVHTMEEFKHNLHTRFSSMRWIEAIDFSRWALVGGCVLNALCQSSFSDTNEQDINLVYYTNDTLDFKMSIDTIVMYLNQMIIGSRMNEIIAEKFPGAPSYNVFLPCDVRLHFTWIPTRNSKNLLSHILHNFDMDICQVAYNGE